MPAHDPIPSQAHAPSQPRRLPQALTRPGLCLAVLAATLVLGACGGKVKDTHPQQWVTQRKTAFKQMLEALEPLGQVSRDQLPYNAEHVLLGAKHLEALSSVPWALFPPDSNYPPTEAKPEVWSQATEFKAAQDHYQASVHQLVQAAEAGQVDAVKNAVNAVQKSCKACHGQFRNAR